MAGEIPAWAQPLTPYGLPQFDRTLATLGGIQPQWQQTYADLIAKAAAAGIPLVAVSGNRTNDEQDALFNSGRGVTRARGGQSYHNYGAAVDLVPASVLGAPDWSPSDPVWGQFGELVSQFPEFEWGGAWSHADPSHVQVRGGRPGSGTAPTVQQQPTMSAPAMAGLAPAAGGGQMASGLLGAAPAAPLRQGWLGGLLGVEPDAEGGGILNAVLNPQNSSDRQAVMQMAAAMLQASGPSTDPRGFGQSLGAGLQGFAQGQEFGAKQDERKIAQRTRMQVEAAISALPPEQQAWARANPDAFAALMMEKQFGSQGPNTTGAPSGFMWNADQTGVVPIPGAPPPTGAAPPELIQQMIYAGIDPQSPQGQELIRQHISGGAEAPKPPPTTGLPEGMQWAQGPDGQWSAQPIAGVSQTGRPDTSGAPSGMMWNADHSAVVPIPGAPGEAPADTFKDEASLREKYIQQSGTYVTVRDAYSRLQASATGGTGASDLSLVYSYMRLLDPNTGVKEGEVATAENAGGIPDTVMNLYNSVISGARLPETVRRDFLTQGTALYQAAEQAQAALRQQYQGLAEHYGFDPQGIALDMTAGTQARPPTPAAPTSGATGAPMTAPALSLQGMDDAAANAAYDQMSPGTVFIGPDGKQYRKP